MKGICINFKTRERKNIEVESMEFAPIGESSSLDFKKLKAVLISKGIISAAKDIEL